MTNEEKGDWLDDLDGSDVLDPPELRDAWERAGEAIMADDDTALRRILVEHPSIAVDYVIGESLLRQAAEYGKAGALSALLEAGVPPNLIDENGSTPLMDAAWNGHLEVVRGLLSAGADPDILVEEQCRDGDTEVVGHCALLFALARKHREVVEILEPVTKPEVVELAYRELPKFTEWMAENPPPHAPTVHLFMACQDKRPDRLVEAIAAGGEVNHLLPADACNRLYGGTPLSFAAATGRMDLVEPLLAAGADPSLAGLDGRTPADIAALNGHETVSEFLRAAR